MSTVALQYRKFYQQVVGADESAAKMNKLVNAVLGRVPIGLIKSLSSLQWRAHWLRKAYLAAASSYTGRDGTVQRGPAKGLRFNAGMARNAGFLLGTYEPEVQKLYAALIEPGMVVYDVGANVGFLSMLAARLVGPSGQVFCFEPLPSNIETIEYNANLNSFKNITVINGALGSQEETVEFLVSADVGWGRLPGLPGEPPKEVINRLPVQVHTLDEIFVGRNLPAPNLIKIDIEGGEVAALEGSRKFLAENRPILLVELHGTNECVERILSELNYQSYVLGCVSSILSAPWYAFVIAAPADYPDRCRIAHELALSARLER